MFKAISVFKMVLVLAVALVVSGYVFASSHSEAPGISKLASLDGTDVYAFVSPDRPDTVTLIACYYPLLEPAAGPNFYTFNDNGVYDILVDNDGDAKEDIVYRFTFSTRIVNGDSVLAYLPGNRNIEQSFTLEEIRGRNNRRTIGSGLVTPPPNVGPITTPSYPSLMANGVYTFGDITTFAGLADDPFFVDLAATFDALTIRNVPGNKGGGVDTLSGFNVLATAVQVPISQLTSGSGDPVIGVWQYSYLPKTTIASKKGGTDSRGKLVEVSRLGMPLVNELIIPLKLKEVWNSSEVKDDAQFLQYVQDPQIVQIINSVYGIPVPAAPRADLVSIFLTGIEGLNKPQNVKAGEVLRLNTSIAPTGSPNRLGVLGMDNGGFPNGRRLADDVVDIVLRAAAGGTPFTPATNIFPNNVLGDGVDINDVPFQTVFPYLGVPQSPLTVVHDVQYPVQP